MSNPSPGLRRNNCSPAEKGNSSCLCFSFFKIYLFVAVLCLHCCSWAVSNCGQWRASLSLPWAASGCGGFSLHAVSSFWLWWLLPQGRRIWAPMVFTSCGSRAPETWLSGCAAQAWLPHICEIFWPRDGTCVPCTGSWIPNHWTSSEASNCFSLQLPIYKFQKLLTLLLPCLLKIP